MKQEMRHRRPFALGALPIGAIALGALALGALAIGALLPSGGCRSAV